MEMPNVLNSLHLCGQVTEELAYSHESHGEIFNTLKLKTTRLSGTVDIINVVINEKTVKEFNIKPGMYIDVLGELRSFNNKTGNGTRLIVSAFAKDAKIVNEGNINQLELTGVVCKPPIYRKTPLGREICDLMLAVNRRYNRADYLPSIAWGKSASECSSLAVGTSVKITGRIQSRDYIKIVDGTEVLKTTYEVSITNIEII